MLYKQPRRTVIKEELVIIAQGLHGGVVLDRILYRVRRAQEEARDNPDIIRPDAIKDIQEGWLLIIPDKLSEQLLLGITGKTIKRTLDALIDLGFLEERKNGNGNKPSHYRPNVEAISAALGEHGYNLEGYHIPPTHNKKSQDSVKSRDNGDGDLWKVDPPSPTDKKIAADVAKGREWVRGQRLLDNIDPVLQWTAYVVYRETGFEPDGTVSAYRKQLQELWSAAGYKESVLVEGLKGGEKARNQEGLTFSGPRSYISYAKNAKSLGNRKAVNVNESQEKSTGTIHRVN